MMKKAGVVARGMLVGTLAVALVACRSGGTPVGEPMPSVGVAPKPLVLAEGGRTAYTIVHAGGASETELLAAAELSKYLGRMTGATFPVADHAPTSRVIVLRGLGGAVSQPEQMPGPGHWDESDRQIDSYVLSTRGDTLLVLGRSSRALLYATYDLLARLGVVWLAPDFAMYEGTAEVVPRKTRLVWYQERSILEVPRFSIRKLDVAQAMSQDTATLRRIIEWMPKGRFTTLQMPQRFGAGGRVQWDNWRDALLPELRRRDLSIEVGGHGYQNFIRADMGEDSPEGPLFDRHPDWFGLDEECKPSRAVTDVFNTENPAAARHVFEGVAAYLRSHPEIDIFDFWPPDGARWARCKSQEALGPPQERQARLLVGLHEYLREQGIAVRLEMIAYAHSKAPPKTVKIPSDVLVDFCPIGQNFDVQIDDPSGSNNAEYVATIREWRQAFDGDISLYGYWRRYAWRSLPVLLPRYMQGDLRWYASVPLQGVSTYAEPADWFTYEVNHFVFGPLAWNPDVNVDSLIDTYASGRFGRHAAVARQALIALEDIVRVFGTVQYSKPRPASEVAAAEARLVAHRDAIRGARAHEPDPRLAAHLERLGLMVDYAVRDLGIKQLALAGADSSAFAARVIETADFLTANRDRGVFALREGNNHERMLRLYGRERDDR